MPDVCNEIEARIESLLSRLAANDEESADLEQRHRDLDADFRVFRRESDLNRIFTLDEDRRRLQTEHSALTTRVNVLYTMLEEIQRP